MPPAETKMSDPSQGHYYTGVKLWVTVLAMMLSVLLVSLDQTRTATAIPRIASEFNSLSEVAWIASGYLLTQAGFLMLYGQLLTLLPTKWVYMAAIAIFELGSLVCGVSPSVNVLIFGRALAGTGGAGVLVSVLSIIAQISALDMRPIVFACFAGVFALSSVAGPLIGGAFSDHVTWRWCFYINLPIGALSLAVIMLLIEARPAIHIDINDHRPRWKKLLRLDWVGAFISVAWVTCLVLALQWGGNEKPWSDPAVIASFVVFGVLLIVWIAWEYFRGDEALMPLKLFRRRSQVGASLEAFFVMICMLLATYYLPLLYQAKGSSATSSGINILAFMLSSVISAVLSGAIIRFVGWYWPFIFCLPLLTCIGAGLLFTITPSTPDGTLIGYQILYGAGLGGALQNTLLAVQAEYNDEPELIPQGTSMVNFCQMLGGIIGISVAGSIFTNQLTTELAIYAPQLPNEIKEAIRQSVTVVPMLPEAMRPPIIAAYTRSLDYAYIVGVPAAALASLSALFVKNRNLNKISQHTY